VMSEREAAVLPWYASGLRFECTGCGSCCTGSPGFVWVNREEIEALAAVVGEESESFEEKYVRKIGARRSLREFPNGDCVFFDTEHRSCTVYAARPRQCRTWPFWESNLRQPERWQEASEACPGCGQGRLFEFGEIEAQRQVVWV
jgi:Fe-S-cluster containining protein